MIASTGMVEFGLENWKSQTVAFDSDGASVYRTYLAISRAIFTQIHTEFGKS